MVEGFFLFFQIQLTIFSRNLFFAHEGAKISTCRRVFLPRGKGRKGENGEGGEGLKSQVKEERRVRA